MPTDVEQQISNYYRWIETRNGVDLRPATVAPREGIGPDQHMIGEMFNIEPGPSTPRSRRPLLAVLSAAAVVVLLVVGLALGVGRRDEAGTMSATQADSACGLPPVDSPALWEGCVVITVYVSPTATDNEIDDIRTTILDASGIADGNQLRYRDKGASLEQARTVLIDDPDVAAALTEDVVVTSFQVASLRSASIIELRQLANDLGSMPGVVDVQTSGDINNAVDDNVRDIAVPQGWDSGFDSVDVVAADASTVLNSDGHLILRLPVGHADGLTVGMTIVNSNGLIGTIDKVSANSSEVLLATDSRFETPGTIKGSASTGVVNGDPLTGPQMLGNTNTMPSMAVGDLVLTSGGSEALVPSGIPIGVVQTVSTSPHYSRIANLHLLADATTNDATIRVLLYQPTGTADGQSGSQTSEPPNTSAP